MILIDAHCHIDMLPKPEEYLKYAESSGNITLGMTNLPSHFEKGLPYAHGLKNVRMALGFHPLLAAENTQELVKFTQLVDKTSYIGEVGLDFSRDGFNSKDIQLSSFKFILEQIQGQKKILSIHSRRAEKEILELLIYYKISNAIFHWYSGNLSIVRKITDYGYYFSINESMIISQNGRKIIAAIPKDKLLTETDAPFNAKCNISAVYSYLSDLHKTSIVDIEALIKNNFFTLLKRIK